MKVCDWDGGLPQWIIKSAIKLWGMLNGTCTGCRR
jgi:hypothetical protein